MDDSTTFPEAPISVTIRGYYKGFSVLVTKRDEHVKAGPLMQGAMEAIDWMIDNGFKPSWNDETNGHAQADPHAPKCGVHGTAMVKRKGQWGEFWACPAKNPDGSWCKFKPDRDAVGPSQS